MKTLAIDPGPQKSAKKGHAAVNFKDLAGIRFGRLTVISQNGKDKWGKSRWLCKCDCGKETTTNCTRLTKGKCGSCGCLVLEKLKEAASTHGEGAHGKRTTEHIIWAGMLTRCNNANNPAFHRYGGRGIKVCGRWRVYQNFLEDMGRRPSSGHSLDRADNNLGYSPENCRWATRLEQMNNTSHNHNLTAFGETKTIAQWSRLFGIKWGVLYWRLKRDTLETLIQKHNAKLDC